MKKNVFHYSILFTNKFLLGVLIATSLVSCQKNDEFSEVNPNSQLSSNSKVEELRSFLAESTGFAISDIVYEPEEKAFVINNDIVVSETDARERASGVATEHYKYNYVVSRTQVTNIDYYIDPAVPTSWKAATRKSIQNWNAVNGTILFMRETTSSSASNVKIKMGYSTSSWVAQAYLPSYNGLPGFQITINSKYNSLSDSYKIFTMTHEMGHTFGLMHTDQTSGVFISGTPAKDANSVMNSYVLPWQAFTAGDMVAVQKMYP